MEAETPSRVILNLPVTKDDLQARSLYRRACSESGAVDGGGFNDTVSSRHSVFITIPITATLCILEGDSVSVAGHRGKVSKDLQLREQTWPH